MIAPMNSIYVLIVDESDALVSSTEFVQRADAYEYARYMLDQQVGQVMVRDSTGILDRQEWLK